jgi:orotate phosphoribosyltransferase
VPDSVVTGLARPRQGHFDLGTGFHGDVWLDLDALFLRPALLRPQIRWLAGRLAEHEVDALCGPMEGGALLGYAVADVLEVAFLAAYRVIVAPGTPGAGAPAYRLPPVPGGIDRWRVAIVDDAVNAGTAVRACAGLLRDGGAVPVAVGALLGLGPASGTVAAVMSVPFHAVATLDSNAWPAGQCPLCADGVPLTDPSGADEGEPEAAESAGPEAAGGVGLALGSGGGEHT